MMKRICILLAMFSSLALAGCNVNVTVGSDCQFTEERTATVPVEDAKTLIVEARAGELRIEGRADLTQVQVKGGACAGDRSTLDKIVLRAEKVGEEVRVEADLPDAVGVIVGNSPRLDLTLEVPAGMTVRVQDSSGDTVIRQVASVDIEDQSGNLDISDIAGDVIINDDSGDLTVSRAGGVVAIRDDSGNITVREARADVVVEQDDSGDMNVTQVDGSLVINRDGSGSIDLRDVKGDVTIREDDSGDIRVTGAERNVTIGRDGSGDIDVQDVKGDFSVDRDGSGDITHRNVGGSVRLPRD